VSSDPPVPGDGRPTPELDFIIPPPSSPSESVRNGSASEPSGPATPEVHPYTTTDFGAGLINKGLESSPVSMNNQLTSVLDPRRKC
jgi:hypothetical protein